MLKILTQILSGSELGARSIRNVAIKLLSIPIALTTNIILARLLGVEGLGVYGVSISIVMLMAMPITTSLDTTLVRSVGKLHGDNRNGDITSVVKFVLVIALIAVLFYYLFIGVFLNVFPEGIYSAILPYTLIFYPAFLLLALGGSMLRSIDYVTLGVLPEQILRQAIFMLSLVLAYFVFTGDQLLAEDAMRMHALSNVVTSGVAVMMLLYATRSIQGGLLTGVRDKLEWAKYYYGYWPLLVLGFVQVASTQVPMLLIGALGLPADAGLFRVSEQLVALCGLGLVSVNLAFGPMFAKVTADKGSMQQTITKASKMILVMVIPATIILMIWPKIILTTLFGESFESAATALRIMCIGTAVSAMVGPVGLVLNILGYEKKTLLGMQISLAVNVITCLLLVPDFGVIGAAIAFCSTKIVWNGVLLFYLYKETGLSTVPYLLSPKTVLE